MVDEARRRERRAHERWARTGSDVHLQAYIQTKRASRAAQAIEDRGEPDTGWSLIQTNHCPRYHREIGGLSLDVEPQVTTWLGAAMRDRVLVGTVMNHRTHIEAAQALEAKFGVATLPLPELEIETVEI
jgi:hypothetical protein